MHTHIQSTQLADRRSWRASCSTAEIMRLTALLVDEELRRWGQLQSGLNGGCGALRLPAAARAASGSLPSPRACGH